MSRPRLLIAGILTAVILAVAFLLLRKTDVPPAPAPPAADAPASPKAATPPPVAHSPQRIALHPPQPDELAQVPPNPMTAGIGSAKVPPEKEIAMVLELFQIYRREFGAFPAGETNAHFMNALRGANPGKLPVFPLQHPRLDPEGNLTDRWGHPYVFHAVSRDRLEIRSKGPDGEIHTPDDLVAPGK
ncbi:type II secretion system protein GspG [Luteolibacter sp. SL250]|uniref:type II secretion system protein GspG n=1 Tax=Luteolibacter sp. SL250 TaxID=2995170 RepID=UPI0022701FE1|nr:type II secretion system protein GspG [Luteolibacter sp. SL250]WAC18637.1 type II secretion system protein GspG [Luteolibacter sp. SL250]